MAGVNVWNPAEVFLFLYFYKTLAASQHIFLGLMHEKGLQCNPFSHLNAKPENETEIPAQRLRRPVVIGGQNGLGSGQTIHCSLIQTDQQQILIKCCGWGSRNHTRKSPVYFIDLQKAHSPTCAIQVSSVGHCRFAKCLLLVYDEISP